MLKIWKTTLSNNLSIIHYSWRDTSYNWYYYSKYTSLWKTMESILLISSWRMLVCFLETGKNFKLKSLYLQSIYLLIKVITPDWVFPEAFLLEKSSSQISSLEPLFLDISSSEQLNSLNILLRFILLRTIFSRNILLRTIECQNYPPPKYPPQNNWIPELSS